jgi:MFS family permease
MMQGSPDRNPAPIYALFGASTISELGNVLTFVAVPWFVLQTTGSAAKTGLTGGAVTLAAVVAGFLSGPIVDRLGFKRMSIVADLASGVTVALIPLLYHTVGLAFWQLLVLVFLGGFLDGPGLTARQSIVPDLAGRTGMRIERANSALLAIQQLSFLLGPLLAGVLIAVLGPSNVLWVDAATFAVSAATIAMLVPSSAQEADRPAEETRGVGRYLADLTEGLRFTRRDRLIFWIIATGVILNFLIVPLLSVVLPVYAERTYGSAVNLGLMLGGFGGGALVGSLLYGAIGHRLPRRVTAVSALVVLGLPIGALAAAPSLAVAVGALFVTGFGIGLPNPLVFTVVQERTPAEMLGRVMGALLALSMAAAPLGTVPSRRLLGSGLL